MKSYAQQLGHLPNTAEMADLREKAYLVMYADVRDNADCHTAAALFVKRWGIGRVVRRWFAPFFEHSWIEFAGDGKSNPYHPCSFILDIYPVGGGGQHPHFMATGAAYRGAYLRDLNRPVQMIRMSAMIVDGELITHKRHSDCIAWVAANRPGYRSESGEILKPVRGEEGFVDMDGNFLTREEAWDVADAAGQIRRVTGSKGTLYSEDLYGVGN